MLTIDRWKTKFGGQLTFALMRTHALGRRIVAPGMGAGVNAPDEAGEVHKTRFMQAVYTAQFFMRSTADAR